MIVYTMTPEYRNPFTPGMTREEVRDAYRAACKEYHPDLHGSEYTPLMQQLNAEYARYCDQATRTERPGKTSASYDWQAQTDERIRDAIAAAVAAARHNPAIRVEITGYWVWVWNTEKRSTSDTAAQICDMLHAAGYKWGSTKKAFYFPGIPVRSHREHDMGEIRSKYGSKIVDTDTPSGPSARAESATVPLFS